MECSLHSSSMNQALLAVAFYFLRLLLFADWLWLEF
jgi:hypothetical protein